VSLDDALRTALAAALRAELPGALAEELPRVLALVLPSVLASIRPAEREMMTRAETAEFLGVCLPQVDRLAAAGRIRRHMLGDSPRYYRSELLEDVRASGGADASLHRVVALPSRVNAEGR